MFYCTKDYLRCGHWYELSRNYGRSGSSRSSGGLRGRPGSLSTTMIPGTGAAIAACTSAARLGRQQEYTIITPPATIVRPTTQVMIVRPMLLVARGLLEQQQLVSTDQASM